MNLHPEKKGSLLTCWPHRHTFWSPMQATIGVNGAAHLFRPIDILWDWAEERQKQPSQSTLQE